MLKKREIDIQIYFNHHDSTCARFIFPVCVPGGGNALGILRLFPTSIRRTYFFFILAVFFFIPEAEFPHWQWGKCDLSTWPRACTKMYVYTVESVLDLSTPRGRKLSAYCYTIPTARIRVGHCCWGTIRHCSSSRPLFFLYFPPFWRSCYGASVAEWIIVLLVRKVQLFCMYGQHILFFVIPHTKNSTGNWPHPNVFYPLCINISCKDIHIKPLMSIQILNNIT